jgi:threonine dehydratase
VRSLCLKARLEVFRWGAFVAGLSLDCFAAGEGHLGPLYRDALVLRIFCCFRNWTAHDIADTRQYSFDAHRVGTTLCTHCSAGEHITAALGTEVFLKLELMQRTGTFKFRGAINAMLNLAGPRAGVTAVSAGNRAVAVACAASVLGIDAKVVMLASANTARRQLTRSFDAQILFCDTGPEAFAQAKRLVEQEGRTFVHPFDRPLVANATGGVGLELCADVADLDAVVVAVGGGGLAGGFAAAVRQLQPQCRVYGVEPDGAMVVQQSLTAGEAL